jgi:hypothetical protein
VTSTKRQFTPTHFSHQQALAEAVFILNTYYDNDSAKGYDGALLDANSKGPDGLEIVLGSWQKRLKQKSGSNMQTRFLPVFMSHLTRKPINR